MSTTQATSTMNDIIENVKGVMNNTKEKFSGSLQFVRETNTEKGTVLRNQLATARTELNDKLHEAETKVDEMKGALDEKIAPVKQQYATALHSTGEFNSFRRLHPEMVVVGIATVVAVPSLLLRGRWFMVRDVIGASTVATTSLFAASKVDEAFNDSN